MYNSLKIYPVQVPEVKDASSKESHTRPRLLPRYCCMGSLGQESLGVKSEIELKQGKNSSRKAKPDGEEGERERASHVEN